MRVLCGHHNDDDDDGKMIEERRRKKSSVERESRKKTKTKKRESATIMLIRSDTEKRQGRETGKERQVDRNWESERNRLLSSLISSLTFREEGRKADASDLSGKRETVLPRQDMSSAS